jgi:hypothetical protein
MSATPIKMLNLGPVATVSGKGYSVSALIMATHFPPLTGDVKIVWRVTGSGALKLSVHGPTGQSATLLFGPDPHRGRNFDVPGDEWGSGFRFAIPGC